MEEELPLIVQLAQTEGNITGILDSETIAKIGEQVCDQYERDKGSREDWEKVATKALEDMAKADYGEKDYPWKGASNVHYPLLSYAVMQFNARAYPAIVKGDEAVSVKVVGADNGQPLTTPDGQPVLALPNGQMVPAAVAGQLPPDVQQALQPAWRREPGAKQRRANRVRDYMNTVLFYRIDNWESETDTLLFQVPAIGCGFRKQWFDGRRHNNRFVPALKLVVDNEAKSLDDAPQITEEIDGVFPHQIRRRIQAGEYRPIHLDPEETEARTLIEAQCYYDLDGDGIDEPYVVTVDHEKREVLRVVADYDLTTLRPDGGGTVAPPERRTYYTKYEFLPHPEGKFYNVGLAHLLDQYGEVINTIINQMIDANHAATAGGGFIASGLKIAGKGQTSTLSFRPGEYKTVGVSGAALKDGMVERTYPQLSPVMFNLLELILGAARDIASIKDVLSGEASNNGQVGTTLALIEQGLQVFTAIYKRVYRGLKAEFTLLFENLGKYGNEDTAREYFELLDDPAADFAADFNPQDMDIRPVSDPSSVTKMQQLSKANFVKETIPLLAQVGGDPREALRRVYDAAGIEDLDKLLPPPQPNPMAEMAAQAEVENKAADTEAKRARAVRDFAAAQASGANVQYDFGKLGLDAEKLALEQEKTKIDAFEAGMNAAQ